MPERQVPITFDIQLDAADCRELARTLGVSPDDVAAFQERLSLLARTVLVEQLALLLGREDLPGKTEMRQRTLLRLVEDVFGGRMPSADTVARIFRLTPAQASALIARTVARYRDRLERAQEATAVAVLDTLEEVVANDPEQEGRYLLVTGDDATVAFLRQLLRESQRRSRPITRSRSVSNGYDVYDSALVAMAERLEMDVDKVRTAAHARAQE